MNPVINLNDVKKNNVVDLEHSQRKSDSHTIHLIAWSGVARNKKRMHVSLYLHEFGVKF